MLKNNKGLELAIGTVAVIAIVLAVILVVINFFLGGVGEAGGGIKSFTKGTAEEANRTDVGLGIKEAAHAGKCLDTFSSCGGQDSTLCYRLAEYGKCSNCDNTNPDVDDGNCTGLPEDLCKDAGCTWSPS